MASDSVSADLLETPIGLDPAPAAPSRTARALAWTPTMRRGILAVFDQAITSGTSFVTSVIIGRSCSQGELGVYYLALSIVLFVRGVQGDAISAPYVVLSSRRKGEDLAIYSGSSLIHQLLMTAATVAILLGLAGTFAFGIGPVGLRSVMWPLTGAVPFLLLREYVRSVSFARLQISTAIMLDIAVAVLQIGTLLALSFLHLLSVDLVYVVMGACCAIACLGWFLRPPLKFHIRANRIAADWRDNWSFAKWTLAGQLINRSSSFLMPWILAVIQGDAATGVLAACITVVNLAGTFITGVNNLLTPEASHAFVCGGPTALSRLLWRTAGMFALTVGGFALVMLVFGDRVAVIVFGSKFAGAGSTLAVLACAMFMSSMGMTAGNGLWAMNQPRANFSADVCTLTVTLGAAALLVHPLGVIGAAAAILLGTIAGSALRVFSLRTLLQGAQFDG